MKYTLDTIPVMDAFKQDCQCPLCRLEIHCEDGYIDSLMSSAYMEPDCRIRTNQTGFCSRHYKLLYERRNRLGLALMTHTHLHELLSSLEDTLNGSEKKSGRFSLFASDQKTDKPAMIRRRIDSCDICDQLSVTMRRYAYTTVRLSLDNAEFRQLFTAHGVCLPHTALLIELAAETLNAKERSQFEQFLSSIVLADLRQIENDLYEFTQQFDYRNVGKAPSQGAKESVEHALNRLSGAIVGEEAAHETE